MLEESVDLVRHTLMTTLMIATPVLGAGLIVGLLISLFQAVTQIQEQTLTFVPKIIAMIVVCAALLSWLATTLMDFAAEMFTGFT